ncbi:MAG: CrcB family protein [Synechococcus sp.]|jgi:CrcB protein
MSEVVTPAPFYWEAILVALGAIPGAWLRLRVVNHFEPVVPHKHWGTFVVNVSAAFFLGLFSGLHALQLKACSGVDGTAPMMLLVGVGFFGSLSTFSTFVVELLNTLQSRQFLQFVGLMVFSLVIGLLAAAAGYQLGLSRG